MENISKESVTHSHQESASQAIPVPNPKDPNVAKRRLKSQLLALWYVLLDSDAPAAYAQVYVAKSNTEAERLGPRLIMRQDIQGYIEEIQSKMRVRGLSGLSAADRDTAVLEAAYRLTQDPALLPRERTLAIKEYAMLRKVLGGNEVQPTGAKAGQDAASPLSDFLDSLP